MSATLPRLVRLDYSRHDVLVYILETPGPVPGNRALPDAADLIAQTVYCSVRVRSSVLEACTDVAIVNEDKKR